MKHQHPPSEWVYPPRLTQRLFIHKVHDQPAQLWLSERDHARLKKQIIRQMTHLIRYFEKSALFEDAEARQALVNELREVLEIWNAKSVEEIID